MGMKEMINDYWLLISGWSVVGVGMVKWWLGGGEGV